MPAAARRTSSRVIVPFGPVPVTVARSTPRSLASLRTGGLASVVIRPGAAGAAGRTGGAAWVPGNEGAAGAVPAGPRPGPGRRGRRRVAPTFTP